jgi:putative aldouronate transport system permease protein
VGHWNSWYDGLLFNQKIENYPLQTYLQVILTNRSPNSIDAAIIASRTATRSLKAAQIFVTMLPILAIYPFMQKYFVKGIVVGSVKG